MIKEFSPVLLFFHVKNRNRRNRIELYKVAAKYICWAFGLF